MNHYRLLFFLVLFISPFVKGQINTYSPYSYFGYGILSETSNIASVSMGGLGISLMDNNDINYLNPATYSFLDQTSFEVGVKSSFIKMSQDSLVQRNFISGLSIIGLGFPISKKIGVAISLSPYSSVGYDLTTADVITNEMNETIESTYNYYGSGGLNRLLFGFSWKAIESQNSNLAVGLNFNYLFGSIERQTTIFSNNSPVYFRDKSDKIMNGLNIQLGVLYSVYLEDIGDYIINIGAQIQPNSTMNYKIKTLQSMYTGPSYNLNSSDTQILLDDPGTIYNDDFPTSYGLGFSVQDKNQEKWLIGLDYNATSAYSSTQSGYNLSSDIMRNYTEYVIGGFFTPNKSDIYNYFNKVQYRFGISYSSGYMDIGSITDNVSDKLKDISFTFGFGLPMNKKFSIANIGFEYGVLGNNSQTNVIQENYFNLYMSMTLNEKWFSKRKIQ